MFAALAPRPTRTIAERDIDRWLERAVLALDQPGTDVAAVQRLREHRGRRWRIATEAAPREVWCGEVYWPGEGAEDPEPDVVIYPDSPWGKLPEGTVAEFASQTGIDHIVSHLYHYFAGQDYSEAVSCADQVRFAWGRRSLRDRTASGLVLLGLRLHKKIPFRTFAAELALPLNSRRRSSAG